MTKTNLLYLPVIAILGLSGCASPAVDMTQQQVSSLSDDQLCNLKNSYSWESKTEVEIGTRNLNCDPAYRQCLLQGFKKNTPEITLCTKQVNENWELQNKLEEQKKEAEKDKKELESKNKLNELIRQRNANKSPKVVIIQR
jgi:hypothetical protein